MRVGVGKKNSQWAFFGTAGPGEIDDFRNAVHDSEGLQMIRGDGTRLWRPLTNPR
ncbi:MAG: glucan biosynthesis protein, partial [Planctomycetota bacterium]